MQSSRNNIEKRMTMLALTWPIFIETFLRMLFMNVDVFMLSAYSDKAVAAVGLINQVGFFLMVLFMMVSSGAGIVIAQSLQSLQSSSPPILQLFHKKNDFAVDSSLKNYTITSGWNVVRNAVKSVPRNRLRAFQFY